MKQKLFSRLEAVIPAALVFISLLYMLSSSGVLTVGQSVVQAGMTIPGSVGFQGEYSWNGTDWLPLNGAAVTPAAGNELILRGHFDTDIIAGTRLNYFRDHITVEIFVNGTQKKSSGVADWMRAGGTLEGAMCGRYWTYWLSSGISQTDEVEIRLYQWHRHGNPDVFREFLNSLQITINDGEVMENALRPYRVPFQLCGVFALIMGLLVLGAALTAIVLKSSMGQFLLIPSLFCLSFDGFILLDVILPSYWNGFIAFYTCGGQVCLMLSGFLLGLCVRSTLTGRPQKAAAGLTMLSGVLDIFFIVLASAGQVLIYDTGYYWRLSQWGAALGLLGCCICHLCQQKQMQLYPLSCILLLSTWVLDLCGVGRTIYSSWTCTKAAVLVVVFFYLARTIKYTILNRHAAVRLEKLERKLEDSRISIMLSQLQPHFLYNVLNSIYYLCRHDPEAARDMIDKFSDYLRNNMTSLEQTALIPFQEEYQHVQTYLSLERLRFRKTLNVVYDIEATDFMLPPLSVQPLIENAVRHGVTKKEGGGTVKLMTRETAENFVVTVADTGRGFDPAGYMQDGRVHIGIQNVRRRLEYMCGGTLTITSTPDVGTTAVITIPKKEAHS